MAQINQIIGLIVKQLYPKADSDAHEVLQMLITMPNNVSETNELPICPVDLSSMWVDFYPSENPWSRRLLQR